MYNMNLVAAGALFSFAAAVPMQDHQHLHRHHQRAVQWVTETAEDVVTVPVIQTVWLNPGESAPVNGDHGRPSTWQTDSSTWQPSSSATESAVVPTLTSPSETATWSPPSSTWTPPPTTPVASPSTWSAPSTSSPAPQPTQSSGGGGGGSGSGTSGSGSGDITWYDVGQGSCGKTSSPSEKIVAMPIAIMEAQGVSNPNLNPLCGTPITLTKGSATVVAQILDTCPSCDNDHLDLSPGVFTAFEPEATGRVHDVSWTW